MSKFNEGDSVVVNQNIHDPDFDICIGGWQGRISEIDTQANLICIEWDSFTLSQMPSEIIEQCEEEGWDWKRMFLQIDEVELTYPRNKKEDVESAIDYLNKKYWWSSFGEDQLCNISFLLTCPWKFLLWLIKKNTGQLHAYPVFFFFWALKCFGTLKLSLVYLVTVNSVFNILTATV